MCGIVAFMHGCVCKCVSVLLAPEYVYLSVCGCVRMHCVLMGAVMGFSTEEVF